MSGRGSPRRKLSCSVISGDLDRQARPDRNPLYAAADPPASGRCPGGRGPQARSDARGPSVGLATSLEQVFSVFALEAVDDRFHFLGALLGSDQEGALRVDDDEALDSY